MGPSEVEWRMRIDAESGADIYETDYKGVSVRVVVTLTGRADDDIAVSLHVESDPALTAHMRVRAIVKAFKDLTGGSYVPSHARGATHRVIALALRERLEQSARLLEERAARTLRDAKVYEEAARKVGVEGYND